MLVRGPDAPALREEWTTQQQADDRLSLLLHRQQRLGEHPAPRIHAVIDEGCLRRAVGGRDVMVEQLQHLEELAARPQMVVQVSPFSLGEDRPLAHPTTLLSTRVPVRDSKDPHGPALIFAADAWSAFVSAVRSGEFGAV
ncbi:Scr1 family TA system antitoxin-like transcriptional regulator [Kitasatospora sp. NPDC059648]|uniref:DUF397 domain-containing protein n=1 Tax=Kitasatospora sp. NPDC059648 TaxID=3346894 RepID=UPI003684C4B6